MPAHLLCCGCLRTPAGRIDQCANGHLLCADEVVTSEETVRLDSCLRKLRMQAFIRATDRTSSCPACRCYLPHDLPRSFIAEEAIALLPTTCQYCAEGRAWQLLLATSYNALSGLHPMWLRLRGLGFIDLPVAAALRRGATSSRRRCPAQVPCPAATLFNRAESWCLHTNALPSLSYSSSRSRI